MLSRAAYLETVCGRITAVQIQNAGRTPMILTLTINGVSCNLKEIAIS